MTPIPKIISTIEKYEPKLVALAKTATDDKTRSICFGLTIAIHHQLRPWYFAAQLAIDYPNDAKVVGQALKKMSRVEAKLAEDVLHYIERGYNELTGKKPAPAKKSAPAKKAVPAKKAAPAKKATTK
jgi:hypothetical protein